MLVTRIREQSCACVFPSALPVPASSTPGAGQSLLGPPALPWLLPVFRAAASAPAAGGGALDLDNKYALFNKHLARNADSVIKTPICFRKGF